MMLARAIMSFSSRRIAATCAGFGSGVAVGLTLASTNILLRPSCRALLSAQCEEAPTAGLSAMAKLDRDGDGKVDDDWVEHRDPATGKSYYHNAKTGETVWEIPTALAKPADTPRAEAAEAAEPTVSITALEAAVAEARLQGYAEARLDEAQWRGSVIRSSLMHSDEDTNQKVQYNLERSTFLFKGGTSASKDQVLKEVLFFTILGALSNPLITTHHSTGKVLDAGCLDVAAVKGLKEKLLKPFDEMPKTSLGYLEVSQNVPNAVYDTAKEVVLCIDEFDQDGNGVLTASEACTACLLICEICFGSHSEEESMNALFAIIDEDGDGFITGQELFSFIQLCFKLPSACGKELGELLEGKRLKLGGVSDVVSSLLAKYDLDGNDKIDLQEFSKLYPVLRVSEPES